MSLDAVQFVNNPEPRCPVILLCDTSGSMAGKRIELLNEGIKLFKGEVEQDAIASLRVEIAIVTFGFDRVQLAQDFVTIDEFTPPELKADDVTPMGEAIEYALNLLEQRKETYKNNGIQYYRPWVFLITDGEPTDYWQNAAIKVREAETHRRLSFFAVGVEGANFDTLKQITYERPPLKLNGLNFKDMFQWLSTSVKQVSASQVGAGTMISLPSVGWGQVSS
ncbi:MAG: vWA domain-containing protein [Xenococcaceae cyanobacterium]